MNVTMSVTNLTREELYGLAWSTPMRLLAPTLGYSDNGLAKICKRLEIPLPGLGYWRKLELGHLVTKKSFQILARLACCIFHSEGLPKLIDDLISQDKVVLDTVAFEQKFKNRITVHESVHKYQPLISKTVASIRSHNEDKYG